MRVDKGGGIGGDESERMVAGMKIKGKREDEGGREGQAMTTDKNIGRKKKKEKKEGREGEKRCLATVRRCNADLQ